MRCFFHQDERTSLTMMNVPWVLRMSKPQLYYPCTSMIVKLWFCDFSTTSYLLSDCSICCVGCILTWLAGSIVVCLMCVLSRLTNPRGKLWLVTKVNYYFTLHTYKWTPPNDHGLFEKLFTRPAGTLPHQTDQGPVCGGGEEGWGWGWGRGWAEEEADE